MSSFESWSAVCVWQSNITSTSSRRITPSFKLTGFICYFLTLSLQTLTLCPRYVCIRGVFILTTECASLTVTLVVTLRKFLSLIFSILYFQNPFTEWHWVGTGVVFLGALLYTEVWSSVRAALRGPDVKEKKADWRRRGGIGKDWWSNRKQPLCWTWLLLFNNTAVILYVIQFKPLYIPLSFTQMRLVTFYIFFASVFKTADRHCGRHSGTFHS